MPQASPALLAGVLSSLFFVILNVAMNIYMKWLFAKQGGDFALPWTMLAVQQLEAFMVLQPCIALAGRDDLWGWDFTDRSGSDGVGDLPRNSEFVPNFAKVLAVTTLFCLNVGLNSLSLVQISITLNQTVRAFLPVGVLLLATVEGRDYSGKSYGTTVILVLGIALTCWGSPGFQMDGFLLAFLSTLVAALGTSLNGRLLRQGPFSGGGPYGVARLIMLQSVPAFFMFSLVAVVTEGRRVSERLFDPNTKWQWYQTLLLVSGSSVLALLSNLGRCFLVAATSALMETLAGNAKVAALCVIDHQIFGTALYSYNYLGIALTFTGFSIHVLLQYMETESNNKKGAEAAESSEPGEGSPSRRTKKRPTAVNQTRARILSGAETGLMSEHVAVQLGRPVVKKNQLESIPEMPRTRSMTWPVGPDTSDQSSWMSSLLNGLDVSQVSQVPMWLTTVAVNGEDGYDALSAASSPSSMRAVPSARNASKAAACAPSARSRFFTDPVESLNSRARAGGGPLLGAVDEEEEDSMEPPDVPRLAPL